MATALAAFAALVSYYYGAPQMLVALLLGMAFHFLMDSPRFAPGVDFAAKKVLRLGIMLLGIRISFAAIAQLGLEVVVMVCALVAITIVTGIILARLLHKSSAFGCLTGGSVAICGASAAMAFSAVLPNRKGAEQETLFTVIAVTSFSTIAMVLYPLVAQWLGLDDTATGIFLGATIHDVAQVVGAGYSVSETTGDTATIVKLMRVCLLLPAVFLVLVITRLKARASGEGKIAFPWFVLGFALLVLLNSTISLPVVLVDTTAMVSRACIVLAVTALGIKTSFRALRLVGARSVVLIILETVLLAIVGILAIQYLLV